jgi:hypothetical protein
MINTLNWATTNNSERPNNFSSDEYVLLNVNILDIINNMHVNFKLDLNDENGGANAIGKRLPLAIKHFLSKQPMDYPEIGYSSHSKTIDFTNGRHRTLAALKMGHEVIPMFVCKSDIKEFKALVRTTPIESNLKNFLESKENEYNKEKWKNNMRASRILRKNIGK